MPKVRKVKKRQKFQYNKNRKRMNKVRVPTISCDTVKKFWNRKRSSQKNMKNMGLKYDVNVDVKTYKFGLSDNDNDIEMETNLRVVPKNSQVIEQLEKNANEFAGANYRMSKGMVELVTYMMDKYDNDYKAMTRDSRNVLQCTWKKFRRMIDRFKSIPEHYNAYLSSKQQTMECN